jgi:IS4 transposase
LLEVRTNLPVFASLHEGNQHEVSTLDEIPVAAGSYYVIDRGYLDFARLYRLHAAGAFFVTRLKSNTSYYVAKSRAVDKTTGLRCDQTIRLNSPKGRRCYPAPVRRISFVDPTTGKVLVFLTNHFALPALTIALIYRRRWAIELFFRWIKQHLRVRGFFSTTPNGVRVQIWTVLSTYLLVAIAKREHKLAPSMYEILQIVSTSAFEQIPLHEMFTKVVTRSDPNDFPNQLEMNYS